MSGTISFLNTDGTGVAVEVPLEGDVTLADFFRAQMGTAASPSDYLVRVNREAVPGTTMLNAGDRVTITPQKISGA